MKTKTQEIKRDLDSTDAGNEGGLSRRGFLGVGAAMAGAMAAMAVGCTPASAAGKLDEKSDKKLAESSQLTGWTGTPSEIASLGGSTMPLADLNKYREEYINKQVDYTLADGTVIPAVFTKVRALIHTYGMGCGNTPYDASWGAILKDFTEEDAQAFLDMPRGVEFTAMDLFAKTGRPLESCTEVCDRIATAGYLCRYTTSDGTIYHQVPYFQGVVEYHFDRTAAGDGSYDVGIVGMDYTADTAGTGTPTFYAMPCDKSVTSDGTVLPFDDVQQIIKTKNKLAIAPCYCRYNALYVAGVEGKPSFADFATGQFEDYLSPICNQRVETCLMMGREAEYWIDRGIAREITREQAGQYMKRSADDGFILQSCFGKDSETICSCHADSCMIVSMWNSIGDPSTVGSTQPFGQISHYTLQVELSKCIKCGKCAERCPVHAITMDGEGGSPKVNMMCYRCGQCAYICPQKARTLVKRPDEEILELPRDFLDDANMKAAYRFEHGVIHEPMSAEEIKELMAAAQAAAK
ncbi:MAG: 4Fe-4S binding protein [Raoultibacter sp.]